MKPDPQRAARRRLKIALLLALRTGDRCAKASAEWLLATMEQRDAAGILAALKTWESLIVWLRPGVPQLPLPQMRPLIAMEVAR